MENEQELRKKLVARGRRYFELNDGASLQDYYGDRFPRVYKDVSNVVTSRDEDWLIEYSRSPYEWSLMKRHTGESILLVRTDWLCPVQEALMNYPRYGDK